MRSAPVGVAGGWEVSLRLCDLLFQAFAKACPRRSPAGCKAMVCHAVFGGRDPRNGEDYVFIETLGGGHGGRSRSDGPDVVQTHHQNTQNTPIEEMEVFYPVRTLRYELIPDSDGAGQFRGGLGVLREYTFPDHEVEVHRAGGPPQVSRRAACSVAATGEPPATPTSTPDGEPQGSAVEDDVHGAAGRRRPLRDLRRRRIWRPARARSRSWSRATSARARSRRSVRPSATAWSSTRDLCRRRSATTAQRAGAARACGDDRA